MFIKIKIIMIVSFQGLYKKNEKSEPRTEICINVSQINGSSRLTPSTSSGMILCELMHYTQNGCLQVFDNLY